MFNIPVILSDQKVWAADKRLQRIKYHHRDYKVNRGKSNGGCTIQQAARILRHTTESVKE